MLGMSMVISSVRTFVGRGIISSWWAWRVVDLLRMVLVLPPMRWMKWMGCSLYFVTHCMNIVKKLLMIMFIFNVLYLDWRLVAWGRWLFFLDTLQVLSPFEDRCRPWEACCQLYLQVEAVEPGWGPVLRGKSIYGHLVPCAANLGSGRSRPKA